MIPDSPISHFNVTVNAVLCTRYFNSTILGVLQAISSRLKEQHHHTPVYLTNLVPGTSSILALSVQPHQPDTALGACGLLQSLANTPAVSSSWNDLFLDAFMASLSSFSFLRQCHFLSDIYLMTFQAACPVPLYCFSA